MFSRKALRPKVLDSAIHPTEHDQCRVSFGRAGWPQNPVEAMSACHTTASNLQFHMVHRQVRLVWFDGCASLWGTCVNLPVSFSDLRWRDVNDVKFGLSGQFVALVHFMGWQISDFGDVSTILRSGKISQIVCWQTHSFYRLEFVQTRVRSKQDWRIRVYLLLKLAASRQRVLRAWASDFQPDGSFEVENCAGHGICDNPSNSDRDMVIACCRHFVVTVHGSPFQFRKSPQANKYIVKPSKVWLVWNQVCSEVLREHGSLDVGWRGTNNLFDSDDGKRQMLLMCCRNLPRSADGPCCMPESAGKHRILRNLLCEANESLWNCHLISILKVCSLTRNSSHHHPWRVFGRCGEHYRNTELYQVLLICLVAVWTSWHRAWSHQSAQIGRWWDPMRATDWPWWWRIENVSSQCPALNPQQFLSDPTIQSIKYSWISFSLSDWLMPNKAWSPTRTDLATEWPREDWCTEPLTLSMSWLNCENNGKQRSNLFLWGAQKVEAGLPSLQLKPLPGFLCQLRQCHPAATGVCWRCHLHQLDGRVSDRARAGVAHGGCVEEALHRGIHGLDWAYASSQSAKFELGKNCLHCVWRALLSLKFQTLFRTFLGFLRFLNFPNAGPAVRLLIFQILYASNIHILSGIAFPERVLVINRDPPPRQCGGTGRWLQGCICVCSAARRWQRGQISFAWRTIGLTMPLSLCRSLSMRSWAPTSASLWTALTATARKLIRASQSRSNGAATSKGWDMASTGWGLLIGRQVVLRW